MGEAESTAFDDFRIAVDVRHEMELEDLLSERDKLRKKLDFWAEFRAWFCIRSV